MSKTIPYDPSLVLGNIVPQEKLDLLKEISNAQRPIEAASSELNTGILLKNELKMMRGELENIGTDTTMLNDSVKIADSEIITAASKYATLSAKNLPIVAKLRTSISQMSDSIESPIDFNKSDIKKLPISADSMTMDVQYFSFNKTEQSSDSVMNSMKSFVSAATSFLGFERSFSMTQSMQQQAEHQREVHDIDGILIITANCTHKNASVIAPCIIDVDKGIRSWNMMVRTKQLKNAPFIKPNDYASFKNIAEQSETDNEVSYNLISGATYGSSFVGMVHVINESSTESDQSMLAVANSLQAEMKVGGWFADVQGGFGVSSSFADSAKELLSSQKITSHFSLVTMGVIPTIVSSEVQLSVKQFSEFSPDTMMEKLVTLQNASNSDQASVSEAASNARTGAQMMAIRNSDVQSVMSAVGKIDSDKNQMLDINSLMTAFTTYVTKAASSESGVPIEYFLKPITSNQLFQMWVAKYFPRKYITSSGDDSASKESETPSETPSESPSESP